MVVPVSALVDPARLHVAARIEAVRLSVDDQGFVGGVGAVRVTVPPSEGAGLPLPGPRRGYSDRKSVV